MERKIGEIFEYNGEWHQCVESDGTCNGCVGTFQSYSFCNDFEGCVGKIFKKLEKVGEPYMLEDKKFQKYRVFHTPYIYNKIDYSWQSFADPYYISLEIKQSKEDMEENHKAEDTLLTRLVGRYVNNLIDYETFEKAVKELYSDKEESKPVLKGFDLEAAKAGKPVCTREGRKARIICFDRRLFYKNVSYPILAVVERSDGEDDVCGYNEKGKVLIEDGAEYKDDLMMLPEKKEGWVNVYKGGLLDTKSYPTKKESFDKACPEGYVDTVKVCWEE